MINGGIFGPKLSGKTTLAKTLSREFFLREGRTSLVLDPHVEDWPDCCHVTADETVFWDGVWKTSNKLVIVEEAATTISRERELIPVFTRMRHCHHKLIVIGHSGMDLLPVMRQQLDVIFLFRQPPSASKVWAEVFCEQGLLASTQLQQYEFLRCQLYQPPKKYILPKP